MKSTSIRHALFTAFAVFLTYTMVFGFRKSFTVCTFSNVQFAGLSFKTCLVISQLLGYMAAKFYGIKFIGSLQTTNRYKYILVCIGLAWLSWLLFAIVPSPYNIIFLFTNGFPLGLLWGVIFSYIEGRKTTDFLAATLSCSFIFSSGFVRSVGSWLMVNFSINEFWIPFFTGLVFALPLLLGIYLIEKIKPPTPTDIALRQQRVPTTRLQRINILKAFLGGLTASFFIYAFATLFRDIRDNFSAEIWKESGYANTPSVFSSTEIPITILVLIVIAALTFVKNSKKAFFIAQLFILIGFSISFFTAFSFIYNQLSVYYFMLGSGLGLYLVYIPFNSIFFERMIAAYKINGNVGFLIYIADSVGYVGSLSVLLIKEIAKPKISWSSFFSHSLLYLSVIGFLVTVFSFYYFYRKANSKIQLHHV